MITVKKIFFDISMKECGGMNNYISENEILRFAIDNGIIDYATIQQQIELKKRKEYLEKHTYAVWNDKNDFWRTYIVEERDGKKERRLLKKKTKEDLEDAIIDYYQDKDSNTFKNRYDKWIERQQIFGVTNSTVYKYRTDYNRFFKGYPIENIDICDITDEDMALHITSVLNEKAIPYKALQGIFSNINGVFKKAIYDTIIPKGENPCDYIDLAMFKRFCCEKDYKTTKQRTLSDDERKALLDMLHNPKAKNVNIVANFAIELALYTGMRVGELSGLKWEDINAKDGYIIVCHSEKRDRLNNTTYISSTKNNKIRVLPLTDEIRDVLKRTKEYELSKGYLGEFVFQDKNGRVHAYVISKCMMRKTQNNDNFSSVKSIHTIRRTLNSNLRNAGVPITTASSLLGHTTKVNELNYTYDTVELSQKMIYFSEAGKII